MVREYEGPRRPLVILVVDLRGPDPELVASRAAGMADDALRAGARVELATAEVDGPRLGDGAAPAPRRPPARACRRRTARAGSVPRRRAIRAPARRGRPRDATPRTSSRSASRCCIAVMAAAIAALRRGCRRRCALGRGARRTAGRVHDRLPHPPDPPAAAARSCSRLLAIAIMFGSSRGIHQLSDLAGLQVPLAAGVPLAAAAARARHARTGTACSSLLVASLVLVSLAGVLSISMAIAPWLLVWGFAALVAPRARVPRRARGAARPRPRAADLRLGRAVLAVAGRDPRRGPARRLRRLHARPGRGHQPRAHVPVAAARRHARPVRRRAHQPVARRRRPVVRRAAAESNGHRARRSATSASRSSSTPSLRGRPDDTLVMRVRASSPDFWRGPDLRPVERPGLDRLRRPSRGSSAAASRSGSPGSRSTVPARGRDRRRRAGADLLPRAAGPERDLRRQPGRRRCTSPTAAIFQNPDGTLRAGVRLDPGAVYTVVSQRPLVTADGPARRRGRRRSPTTSARSTRRRRSPPIASAALAHTITADAPTTYDKVLAIEQWLGAHTKYSLDIPPPAQGRRRGRPVRVRRPQGLLRADRHQRSW